MTGTARRRDPGAQPPGAGHRDVDAFELTDVVTRIRRALRASIRSDFPWETLPMAQVEILQRLSEEPGLRVGDIARRHRLAANTVSNLVQAMVTAELITRTADPDDRRAVVLTLTRTGETRLREWEQAHAHRIDTALRTLPRDDRRAIAAALPALTRLAAHLEQGGAVEPPVAGRRRMSR